VEAAAGGEGVDEKNQATEQQVGPGQSAPIPAPSATPAAKAAAGPTTLDMGKLMAKLFPPESPEGLKARRRRLSIARANDLGGLLRGYRLTAESENKSPESIKIVATAVCDLYRYLAVQAKPLQAKTIDVPILRAYLLELQGRRRFAHHRFTHPQSQPVSASTVNGYARALSIYFAWLKRDGWIDTNPFDQIRIPRSPPPNIEIMSEAQIQAYFAAIDATTPKGHRDYAMSLLLLDTGVRNAELGGIRVQDVDLDNRTIRIVQAKGGKERIVPVGARLQKALWTYLRKYRHEPATPHIHNLFLTDAGQPIIKERLDIIVRHYGQMAGISRPKCHPHAFRHLALTSMLRNGMDVFTVMRISGHASVDSLERYVHLAQSDISKSHRQGSPADNLDIKPGSGVGRKNNRKKSTG
jgi:site-specific recombinase XerD